MTARRSVEYVELDTLQDLGAGPEPVTYRWCREGELLPPPLQAMPLLISTTTQPTKLEIARGLGIRERVTMRFRDAPDDGDVFGDEPAEETTFWRLFRARLPWINGRALRIIRGRLDGGQIIDAETRHYVARRIQGPRKNGEVEIEAEDLTGTLARGRAQAPAAVSGTLAAAIDASQATATIAPASAADEYPDDGWLRIGDEACTFVRTGADLVLSRAQLGTVAEAHDAGDEVQPIVVYADAKLSHVAADLLTTYAGIPSAMVDEAAWEALDDEYLALTVSRIVWDPTDVESLLSELTAIFPLVIWYDPTGPAFGFQPLDAAAFAGGAPLIADLGSLVAGSLQVSEDPDISWTRLLMLYGVKDFSQDLDTPRNYQRAQLFVNDVAELPQNRGEQKLRVLPVPWLDGDQGVDARRLADRLQKIGEHDRRTVRFILDADQAVAVGSFLRLRTAWVVGPDGSPATAQLIVTSARPLAEGAQVEIEATDLYYRGNYRRYAPDDLPAYDSATQAQRDRWGYLADDDNHLGAADDPAHTYL